MTDTLRLNLGDASEARIYYLPHVLADRHGFFAEAGVRVQFIHASAGGNTPMGGQLGAVMAGEADLAVGGPMVSMKLQAEGVRNLVSVCALVRADPWVLAARRPVAVSGLAALRGQRILDVANVTTAHLCLRFARQAAGLADIDLPIVPGSGREEADLAAFAAGEGDVVHHSLHALGPWLADGRLQPLMSMAGPVGPVPWSTYIARADCVSRRPGAFAAFRGAMARALAMLATAPADAVAADVASHYPTHAPRALAWSIAYYRAAGIWARDPIVPRAEFAHFARIMVRTGWLADIPDVGALMTPEISG